MAELPTKTGVPKPEDLAENGELLPPGDAYALLSKPTLDLTFEDIRAIADDLRAKRRQFLQGRADKPKRIAAAKPTAEEKAARGEFVASLIKGGIKL